jgi:phage baseplate assembly protein W
MRNKVTDDLLTKKDDAAVKQAVIGIIMTNKGERLYNANIGSNIRRYLFEPLDFGTAGGIADAIKDCLNRYEPRVNISRLEVQPDFVNNGFAVFLEFKIIGRFDIPPRSIEFFLNRTR